MLAATKVMTPKMGFDPFNYSEIAWQFANKQEPYKIRVKSEVIVEVDQFFGPPYRPDRLSGSIRVGLSCRQRPDRKFLQKRCSEAYERVRDAMEP